MAAVVGAVAPREFAVECTVAAQEMEMDLEQQRHGWGCDLVKAAADLLSRKQMRWRVACVGLGFQWVSRRIAAVGWICVCAGATVLMTYCRGY